MKKYLRLDVPLTNVDLRNIKYNSNEYIYDLFGICNHMGSVYSGHYTAYVKNANNSWYEFNDQIITKIDNKKGTNNAYCFFL